MQAIDLKKITHNQLLLLILSIISNNTHFGGKWKAFLSVSLIISFDSTMNAMEDGVITFVIAYLITKPGQRCKSVTVANAIIETFGLVGV